MLLYSDLRYSLYIFHTEFIVLKNFLNPKKWMPMDHAHMYSLSWIIIPFKECFKFVIHPVLYSSLNYSALGGPLIWICFRFFNRWRIQFTAHKRQQPTHIYLSFSPADRFSNFLPQSEVHLNAVYSFVLIKKKVHFVIQRKKVFGFRPEYNTNRFCAIKFVWVLYIM